MHTVNWCLFKFSPIIIIIIWVIIYYNKSWKTTNKTTYGNENWVSFIAAIMSFYVGQGAKNFWHFGRLRVVSLLIENPRGKSSRVRVSSSPAARAIRGFASRAWLVLGYFSSKRETARCLTLRERTPWNQSKKITFYGCFSISEINSSENCTDVWIS